MQIKSTIYMLTDCVTYCCTKKKLNNQMSIIANIVEPLVALLMKALNVILT